MGGWVDECKSGYIDCLQQSKMCAADKNCLIKIFLNGNQTADGKG
jgi:hypothetical protein